MVTAVSAALESPPRVAAIIPPVSAAAAAMAMIVHIVFRLFAFGPPLLPVPRVLLWAMMALDDSSVTAPVSMIMRSLRRRE